MNWWWLIGDVVLILVVAPVCILFLNKVLRPILEIRAYADDILEHGVGITAKLDSVPQLVRTRDLCAQAHQAAGRYGAVLGRVL